MVDGSFQRNWEVFSVLPVIRSSEAISGFHFSEAVLDILHVDSGSARIAFSAAVSAPTRLCSLCFTRVVESCLGSRPLLTEFLGSFCHCSLWSVLTDGMHATLPSWFCGYL